MGTDGKSFVTEIGDCVDLNTEYEICVCCHKKINITKNEELDFRSFYIEGAGQLCYDCYHQLYDTGTKRSCVSCLHEKV